MEQFDYIVVGGGSAGCVVASRLSEDREVKVLLLEAGPSDKNLFIHVPSGFPDVLKNTALHWRYQSEPEAQLGGRRIGQQRGKVLGGSSSINAMAFVRGHPLDYENWVDMGAVGWSYADVLPYFRKCETYEGGADIFRGDTGPLGVQIGSHKSPLVEAFIESGVEAGYARRGDLNGYQQEGFGLTNASVWKGRRANTAQMYLRPVRHRNNLVVRTHSTVHRVVLDQGVAKGVQVERHGQQDTLLANREVVLCGGAINSPKLLMLSGIGPGEELQKLGLEVTRDLPGVGVNLMDHLCLDMYWECLKPVTVQPYVAGVGRTWAGLQWLLFKNGAAARTHYEASGFLRSRAGIEYPDIQIGFIAAALLPNDIREDYLISSIRHGFSTHIGHLRPLSRGKVVLRSPNPHDAPKLFFNYLGCNEDWIGIRAAVRLTREIFLQPAFKDYCGKEIFPGHQVCTDDQIDNVIRAFASTNFHPTGTCRIGNDKNAVVDPEGRVFGVENLRIADASLMPQITSGNTNAPTIMIGEKISDFIRGRCEPRSDVDFYRSENWRQTQRMTAPLSLRAQ